MSRNDFIKGYSQGYNNAYRPSSPQTKVVERVVTQYDNSASASLVEAVVNQRQIIKEKNIEIVKLDAVVGTLKKALHKVSPDHPLVNPLRTTNNPELQQVEENAETYFLEKNDYLPDPEFEALALAKGEPWVDEEEPASVEPDDPVQSRSEEGEPGVEGKPVKEKKGGFWGWFNNPTGVGA